MVRYFFHVMSDVQIAIAHAFVIARELAIEAENYVGFSVCVTDDHGHKVARVPIARDAH
jgi:hypothetical protein